MLHWIISWSLGHRPAVLLAAVVLVAVGAYCAQRINVEAYPDPTPPIVGLIAQNPALSATEMERLVTVPLEVAMAGIRGEQYLRSTTMSGLSSLTVQFHYGVDYWAARQEVLNRFGLAQLPQGVTPSINPDTPGGEMFFRFVLRGPGYNLNDLKSISDWVLDRQYKHVEGVAESSSFGGTVKQYEVVVSPEALKRYGLTLSQVQNAVANSNANVGGDILRLGAENFDVRGLGLLGAGSDPAVDLPRERGPAVSAIRLREDAKVRELRQVVIAAVGGVPITLGQIGTINITHAPRLGRVGINDDDEVVQSIVFKYRGVQSSPVLQDLRAKTAEVNASGIMPPGMVIEPYYDQTKFIGMTTETVFHNLAIGMGLVALVLLFFLGNWNSALIVAATVPLALLFAITVLYARGLSANLLSIGAVDFGIIVDSSVIIVENIYRHLTTGLNADKSIIERILIASGEVQRAVLLSTVIIVCAFIPLFAMQGPEGQIFGPMAETYAFAISGGLLLALTLSPVLCSLLLARTRPHRDNVLIRMLKSNYLWVLERVLRHRVVTLILIGGAMVMTLLILPRIGAEFMPELDEGNLWLRVLFPQQTSLEDAATLTRRMRQVIRQVPEVTTVLSQLGRPDDGSDPTPTNNCEFFIDLKPPAQRAAGRERSAIVRDLERRLRDFSGVSLAFSQPIRDNVFEILTGVKGEDSVKLFGTDLKTMEHEAQRIAQALRTVPGIVDVAVLPVLGKPEMTIHIDRARCARYGVQVADVEAVIQGAVGVKAFTQMVEGEKTFDVILRLPPEMRSDPSKIAAIPIDIANSVTVASAGASSPASSGTTAIQPGLTGNPGNMTGNTFGGLGRIPLRDLADIEIKTGPSMIYREHDSARLRGEPGRGDVHHPRFVAVKFAVRGRDLATAVTEAQQRVGERVGSSLPPGYALDWGGEYKQMLEANDRLAIIIPVSLFLILVILYTAFNSAFDAFLVLTNVIDLSLGGIWALYLTGTPFSVSAAVGFISIFGVAVQDGILLVSYFNQLRGEGLPIHDAIMKGAELRLRPIVMTSLTAALGLLPAAFSTRLGAQPQRPLAIVVVGGMLATLFLTRYLMPVLYSLRARSVRLEV
jgi:cobalt-zinc-cadmium resistance protein CzcA